MATLDDLLQKLTFEQALAMLLAYYQKVGFPTSSWQDFDTDLTRTEAFATVMVDVVGNQIPAIAGGSLLDYAPNYPGWMPLTAKQFFNLDVLEATYTFGNFVVTNSSGASYPFSDASPITFAFASSGNRYLSVGSGTIPAHGSLTIQVRAEFAGAKYVDPSNSGDLSVVTPSMPGVTVTNPSTPFTGVTQTGSGTGSLTLGGSPTLAHSVLLTILATSTNGPVSVEYSLDAQTPISLGTVSSVTNLGGTGINITFVDGASGVSWVEDDTFEFSTPASWITSQGADEQADLSLADDCRNRWSTLSEVPTQNYYALLAKRTPGVGAQVTQVYVVPDATINNKVNIVVAGPGGVLPAPTITTIQQWINPWARGTDRPVVQSPTTIPLTIAASAIASSQQLAAAQAAVSTALLDYVAAIPVNGVVELGEIITIIRSTAGVLRVNVSSVLINGAATDLTLGGPGLFVLPQYPPTINITWSTQ